MILEEATFDAFGYYTKDLTLQSGKPIIAACELCGEFRITNKRDYRTFCKSCIRTSKNNSMYGRNHTDKAKALMSAAMNGEKHPNFGKRCEECGNYKGGKKAADARQHAKRKRQLGYTLLMPLKDGDLGHHVTNEYVIGIPADIHNSMGGRRRKHRTRILQWLKANDEKKYLKVLCVLAKEPLQKSA